MSLAAIVKRRGRAPWGKRVFLDIHRLRIDTSNLIRGRLPKGLGMNLGNLGNRPGIVPNY